MGVRARPDATLLTMPAIDVRTLRALPPDVLLEAAANVYLDAFSRPPYGETADDRAGFLDRTRRYASRDGFRLVAAHEDGRMVGIGLAVVAHPGDWYREQLASQLSSSEVDRWLGARCLEVVHLAVRPAAEGRGIGAAVLGALVAESDVATAVLTVDPRAERARRLYVGHGWLRIRDDVRIGAHDQIWLMARDL